MMDLNAVPLVILEDGTKIRGLKSKDPIKVYHCIYMIDTNELVESCGLPFVQYSTMIDNLTLHMWELKDLLIGFQERDIDVLELAFLPRKYIASEREEHLLDIIRDVIRPETGIGLRYNQSLLRGYNPDEILEIPAGYRCLQALQLELTGNLIINANDLITQSQITAITLVDIETELQNKAILSRAVSNLKTQINITRRTIL